MEKKVGNVLGKFIATAILFSCLFEGNQAQSQQQQQQCMEPLRFCISYLNNTSRPPDSCCQPLDYIVKSLPNCFCNLISTLVVNRIESKDMDVSKAQTLPSRCGQRINPLECITGTSAQSNNPTPNSANSISWDYSTFVITMAASSIILIFQTL